MTKVLVKVYKNGTKEYIEEVRCDRCGGAGSSDAWKYTGMTCYKCGGTGRMAQRTLEYTPEHEAELLKKREMEAEKKRAEYEAWLKAEEERIAEEKRLAEEKQKAIEAQKAISQYQGEVGQKITVKIVERHTAEFETHFGYGTQYMNIHIMKDAEGNVYTWKTQNGIGYWNDQDWISYDQEFTITGTIKEHSEYKGEKQTVLTRCKIKAA